MRMSATPSFRIRRAALLCAVPLLFAAIFASSVYADEQEPASRHAVFDLIANRTLAHIEQRGGLFIVAGSPGFVRYTHFSRPTLTWRPRVSLEGRKVALAQASARLAVPLTAAEASSDSIWLRVKVLAPSSVKITTGGKSSAAVALKPGWQLAEVKLPSGALHAGENELAFVFAHVGSWPLPGPRPAPAGAGIIAPAGDVKAAAAVEWLQIGGTAPPDELVPPRLYENAAVQVPAGGALYYYVFIPHGGALRLKGSGNGCTLKLSLTGKREDGAQAALDLDAKPLPLQSHDGVGIDVQRLGLHAQGSCTAVSLLAAEILGPGAPPSIYRGEKPRNIVFWLSDDTRADKFHLWNKSSRVETPVLDAFSAKATRFAVAYAQGNESRVSHASLFTGLYPAQHKFIQDKAVLSSQFTILPEALKMGGSGLFTIGHIANGYICKRWGFGDGWDFMKNHIHEGGGLKGEDLVADAKDFLQKGVGQGPGKAKPFFLYLGTIDAHVSWRAHEPWITRYDTSPYSGPFVKGCMDPQLDRIVAGQLQITPRDRERVVALYDSDVSYNDQQFGLLLKLLKDTGHEDDTLIVYTSDHGEEFWDHGRIGHGQSLRQELVHIPMWLYYPPLFPAGRVVEEGVELVDILPTLTDAMGLPTPKEVQGESLIGLAQGLGAGYPRPAVASQYELAHAMRLGRYKLWVGGSGQIKLFDAVGDPGEQHELSASEPIALRFITDAMGLWMAYQSQWKKTRWGVASNQRSEFAADLEK
jgi:arylsulfatase A-like enzyme